MKKIFLISFLGLITVFLFFNLVDIRNQSFAGLIDEDPSQIPGYDPDTPTIPYEEPPPVPDVDIPPDIFDTTDIPPDIDTSDVPLDIPSVFDEPDIESFIPPRIDFPAGALDAEGAPRTGCPPEGLVPCGTPGCPCTFCDLFVMFDRIIDFLLVPCSFNHGAPIVLLIATLMLAIGGFMYIFAYAGPAELLEGGKKGGSQMLSQAKRLFKAVVFGLLIIYGAWLIVNTFFWAIGATVWEGGGHWWEIECETTVPSVTGPSVPSVPSIPSVPSVSVPSISRPEIGKVVSVNDKIVSGDELEVEVTFQNPTNTTKEYRLYVYDAQGNEVTRDPYWYWKNVKPGQTHTLSVSTDWNRKWDITNLGGKYRVELREYSVGTVFDETRNIPSVQ